MFRLFFCMGIKTKSSQIGDSAELGVKIIKNAALKVYAGAPHGMTVTLADQVNADLLAFIGS